MSELFNWSVVAANNNFAVPDGFPEGMTPAQINNAARELMAAWARFYADTEFLNLSAAFTVTRPSASVIRIAGVDQTSLFVAGVRIRSAGGASPQFGFVVSSVFSAGNTNVTVDYTADAATNQIRLHIARSIREAAFFFVGTASGEVPSVDDIPTLVSRQRASRKKTTADQTTGAGTTQVTIDGGGGAGDYIAIPGADGALDYLISAVVAYQRTATTGAWSFLFQVHQGTNGTTADAVILQVPMPGPDVNEYGVVGLTDLSIVNPAAGQRLSFSILKGGGVAAGVNPKILGSNAGAKPDFSYFTIEEAL